MKTRDLRNALDHILPCIDLDQADWRPVLACVYFQADGDTLTITATDGMVIAERTIDTPAWDFQALVPYRAARALLEFVKGSTEVGLSVSDGMLIVDAATRLRIDLHDGREPGYRKVWDKAPTTEIGSFNTRELLNTPRADVNAGEHADPIPVGAGFYHRDLIRRAVGNNAVTTICGAGYRDPILLRGLQWRALVMPMTMPRTVVAR